MSQNAKACKDDRVGRRLCVLTTTYPRDELDSCPPFVYELCRQLAADFHVTVIAPAVEGAISGQWQGVQVIRYRYAPRRFQTLAAGGGILPNLRRAPWQLIWLPGLILAQALTLWRHRQDFDLIHAHWLVPQGALAVAIAGSRPVVCTAHGADVLALRGALWNALRRWVMGRSALTLAVSPALQETLQSQAGKRVELRTLSMGLDLQRFAPSLAAGVTTPERLLFVGRLVPKKGLAELLHSLALLVEKRPQIMLDVAGDGPERSRLQSLVSELGLDGRVRFLGGVAPLHLPALYVGAAAVALPFVQAADGDAEGLGLTLLEALACGCKVVAGQVPAQQTLLQGLPGLWVCAAADSAALAANLADALDTPADPQQLRAARQELLEDYGWPAIAAAHAVLFKRVLSQP